jgi:hypothetical protein
MVLAGCLLQGELLMSKKSESGKPSMTRSEQAQFERGQKEAKSGDDVSVARMVHESTIPGDHLTKEERAAYKSGVASVKNNR